MQEIVFNFKAGRGLSVDELKMLMETFYAVECFESVQFKENGKVLIDQWKFDREQDKGGNHAK